MLSESINDLAAAIQVNTSFVNQFLEGQGLPPPSLEANSPPMLPLSPEATAARDAALEALDKLKVLLLGPMMHVVTQVNLTIPLRRDPS